MRLLSTLDWNDFFEKVSLIEPLLGKIRRRLSREWSLPRAIAIATSSSASANEHAPANSRSPGRDRSRRQQTKTRRQRHVGYYLIDAGLANSKQVSLSTTHVERLRRFLLRHRTATISARSRHDAADHDVVLFFMSRYGVGWPF
jgi:hypothetical protein